jgi:hypothetical protein
MIIPIVKSIKGVDQTIGTARVVPESDEVEFYLKPGYSMTESVKKEMAKQLKKLARK